MKNILAKENDKSKQNLAGSENSQQVLQLPQGAGKPVYLNFNGGTLSSDAGVLMI